MIQQGPGKKQRRFPGGGWIAGVFILVGLAAFQAAAQPRASLAPEAAPVSGDIESAVPEEGFGVNGQPLRRLPLQWPRGLPCPP